MPYLKVLRDLEYRFNFPAAENYFDDYWWTCFVWSGVYLLFVYLGTLAMKNRKPFVLQRPLYIWNLFLAFFSIFGLIRCTPPLIDLIRDRGYLGSVCFTNGHQIPEIAIWPYMFVFSKIWEFADTFFIVLRKKPLIFLHWYHHISVLCFTYYMFYARISLGHYFGVMNYTVHSIMYIYYSYSSSGRSLPGIVSKFVTRLQLAQMLGGLVVTFSAYYALKSGDYDDCMFSDRAFIWSMLLYFSYAVLFAQLYMSRYSTKPKTKIPKSKTNDLKIE